MIYPAEDFQIKELTLEDIEVLDAVIAEVDHLNSQQIIDDEDAYKCTDRNCIIP